MITGLMTPFVPPPQEITVVLRNGKASTIIRIITQKVNKGVDYIYSAYAPEFRDPILQLLSWPSVADLQDALDRAHSRKVKV